jgi:hypothetical protein
LCVCAWVAATGVRRGAALASTRGRMADGARATYRIIILTKVIGYDWR